MNTIKDLLQLEPSGQTVEVKGWVRTFRNNQFIALNDGSTIHNLQAVVDFKKINEDLLSRITTSSALGIKGKLEPSQGKGQKTDLIVEDIIIYGDSEADISKEHFYPIKPQKNSLEFLRELAHLRFRTSTFSAIFRMRHHISFAIHKYFNDLGFFCLHSPIITATDAEGAGEAFKVTNFDLNKIPRDEKNEIDYTKDFFGKATNLTVSGQLEAELAAMGLGKVYTFGPTFRAENSNTARHLAEFWMIEPEVAFVELKENMDLAEGLLKYCIQYAFNHCAEDLVFLHQRLIEEEKQNSAGSAGFQNPPTVFYYKQ